MPYNMPWQNPYATTLGNTYGMQPTVQPPAYTMPQGPTKVNGPQSAMQMGYQMGPNRMSEAIFDTNGKVFYIVTTDGAGVPSLETFDFSPHVAAPTEVGDQYVPRSEFNTVIAQLKEAIDGIHGPVQAAATADATATA